jgi:aconitate hydratase
MLVVAYALAGSVNLDLTKEPVGYDKENEPVYLKDIWPAPKEIASAIRKAVKASSFKKRYGDVFKGDANWKKVKLVKGQTYNWDIGSTYVKNPPFFDGMAIKPAPVKEVKGARVLALFGDSITTDHISPAGNIKATSPGGTYLSEHQVAQKDFNSYGSRRGNFEVMERGTFANIRIRNEMMGGKEGGNTIYYADPNAPGDTMSIFDAAARYKEANLDTIVIGGKEYGTGSSRDWAAKGTLLLGVKAVIAESFERIHRSNLVGMGVLPLQFLDGQNRESLGLTGAESFSIEGVPAAVDSAGKTRARVTATLNGASRTFDAVVRIDTPQEAEYYRSGGILPYVLRQLAAR